jgi:anti-sigma B factor antagonist
MLHFQVEDEALDETTHVVRVLGEFDVSAAPQVSGFLTQAIGGGRKAIVIDLMQTTFVDSTGLSVLLNNLRRLVRQGGAMAIACTNPTVLRLFEITGTDQTFDIEESVEGALEKVRPGVA